MQKRDLVTVLMLTDEELIQHSSSRCIAVRSPHVSSAALTSRFGDVGQGCARKCITKHSELMQECRQREVVFIPHTCTHFPRGS